MQALFQVTVMLKGTLAPALVKMSLLGETKSNLNWKIANHMLQELV